MKRLSNIAKNLTLLFCCALPSLYALRQVMCNDIWLHLRTGAWIWNQRAVPHTQLYSFLLGPKEWIDHEWLFQAIIHPIFYLAGLNVLIIFRFLIISLILGLFFIVAKKASRYLIFSALTVVLSVIVASPRFFIRPEIFSLLFTVVFIFLLKSYQGQNWIFLTLPLQILWVNIHGYYVIGPLLVGLFILAKFIEAKARLPFCWNENRLNRASLRKIIYLFFLLIIAFLINPYYLKGALFPFRILGSIILDPLKGSYLFGFITELRQIPAFHIVYSENLSLLSAVIIVFFFSQLINIKRTDIFDLVVFFSFLALAIKANRHIGLFGLSSGILTLFNFSCAEKYIASLRKEKRPIFKLIHHKAVAIVVTIILVANLIFIISDFIPMVKCRYIYNLKGEYKSLFFGKFESSPNYPIGAARFIKQNHIKGNIFDFFNQAAYLIFALYPDCRVFIDGRTEVQGDTVLKAAELVLSKPSYLDGIKDNLAIECVILPCKKIAAKMFTHLYKNKFWKLVFFDGNSFVFIADKPEFRALIKKERIDLEDFHIEPDRGLIELAKKKRFYPSSFMNTARFFYHIDMPKKSLEAIEIAEEVLPKGYDVHSLKAICLANLGRYKEANEAFFKAAEIEPRNPAAYKSLGVFYLRTGHPELAKDYFEKGLKVSPRNKELQRCLKEVDKYIK